jgi:hypothetical protein
LHQTLRRRFGAANVTMDTFEGWAKFEVRGPDSVDFEALPELLEAAGYTYAGLQFTASGEVLGDDTSAQAFRLANGQEFELDEEQALEPGPQSLTLELTFEPYGVKVVSQ